MDKQRLIPYSVYLPPDLHAQMKEVAKTRQASRLIRDAVAMILAGSDAFKSGYIKGIRDAAQVVYDCQEAQMVAVKGKDVGAILTERILELEST